VDRIPASLIEVLSDARRWGFLGPGPVEHHLRHSQGFVDLAAGYDHDLVIDLGSGGGVPGLILARSWPETTVVLLDASQRRTSFLRAAVERLELSSERVEVVRARAEDVGRWDHRRGSAALVVARAFGPPAATAECAAPLLRVGGRLVVSEPPRGQDEGTEVSGARWPQGGLDQLGLVLETAGRAQGYSYQVLRQERACPARFPRRTGRPAKRPLF